MWYWRYNVVNLSLDLTRPPDMSVRFYGKEPLKESHHSAKCVSHRHCGSRRYGFRLTRDLASPHEKRVEHLNVSHNLVNSGGYRH